MTRKMMRDIPHFQQFIKPKQPNPTGRTLPSKCARDFYVARRLKTMPDGRVFSFQNHMTGSVMMDYYGEEYEVKPGGPLHARET